MNRILKKILSVFVLAVFVIPLAQTAYAESAKIGDTIIVSVSIDGGTELYSFRTFINYDAEKLDYLSSDDCGVGTTVVNDTVSGQFAWASLFYNGEENFLKETKIMEITFIAKTEIDDAASAFEFDIKDAYDSNAKMINSEKIKKSVSVVGEGFSQESEAASEAESVVSPSGESESYVSGESSASNSSETGEKENIASDVTSNGIVMTYDEAEFDGVPPIKFDSQKKTDEHRTFKIVSISAVAFFLLVALIGFILLKVKKEQYEYFWIFFLVNFILIFCKI